MSDAYRTVVRGGFYYRVVAPEWTDPANTAYSKLLGGRWNPPGEFGALYLNATIEAAAANVRARHAGHAIKLFDLLPQARPELVTFDIPMAEVLDACTSEGLSALGFADNFPYGVAARSHAEVTPTSFAGEELALFEQASAGPPQSRKRFDAWYPDPIPG